MSTEGRSRLGFWSIVLLGINAVIGSGGFLLPGKAMDLVGPGSIFVYLFMTLVVMAIALCCAECAGRFSRNGAAYVYAKEACGDFVGCELDGFGTAALLVFYAFTGFEALAVGTLGPALANSTAPVADARTCPKDSAFLSVPPFLSSPPASPSIS